MFCSAGCPLGFCEGSSHGTYVRHKNKERKNTYSSCHCLFYQLSLVLSPSGHITLIKMSQMTRLNSLPNSWKTQLAFVLSWVRTSLGCHHHDTRSCMFWMDTVTDCIPTWFPVCARLNYWAIVCFVKSPHSIRNTRAETRCQSQSQYSSIMWHRQVFAARPASKRHSSLE